MTSEKSDAVFSFPPAYVVNGQTGSPQSVNRGSSKKSKALFGYAVAVTTALVVVLIMGGVYYYRSLDVLLETIKKFRVVDNAGHNAYEDVEIDMSNNYVVLRLTGNHTAPGTFAVLDYTKSISGFYEPKSRICYLIGGIKSELKDLQTLNDLYAKQTVFNITKTHYYKVGDNYPVSDKTIMPGPLMKVCTTLPVYWLEQTSYLSHDIQKRKAALTSFAVADYACCCAHLA